MGQGQDCLSSTAGRGGTQESVLESLIRNICLHPVDQGFTIYPGLKILKR